MRAKIQGTVVIECVVQADGSVGDAIIIRSLDQAFGLDQEALHAARAWRFTPGTRAGQPVPVIVTIELTFTLRDDRAIAQEPAPAPRLQTPVNVQAVVSETQWVSRTDKAMRFVWWIPAEFWRVSVPATASREQIDQLVGVLRPYTLIAVAAGDLGPLGGVTWAAEDSVRSQLAILDSGGREYAPVPSDQVSADARNVAAIMRPVLGNVVGPMGQNMHFVYFPSLTPGGTPIADSTADGSFSVRFGSEVHRWRLPVGSLLPSKVCPVDGERLNGAWK